jgi:hypothetical protein
VRLGERRWPVPDGISRQRSETLAMASTKPSIARLGFRKAGEPLVGLEPLRLREKREPVLVGFPAVWARRCFTALSCLVLVVGGLLWSQFGVR